MSLNQNSFCIHYFTIWKNSKENHACNIPDEFRCFFLFHSFLFIVHQWHLDVLRVTIARCHAGAEQDQENGCHGCHFWKASRGCVFHKPRSEWTVWANLRCDFLNMSSKLTWEDSNKSFGHPPWLGWQPQISILPGLVNIQKTIETMAIEIVDLPINSMVIFHSYVNVYQRVSNNVVNTQQ